MKKILIKNDIIDGGGVEIILQMMVKYFVDKGHEVTVVVDDGNKKDFHEHFPQSAKLLCRCYNGIKIKSFFHKILNHFVSDKYRKVYNSGIEEKYDVAIAIKDGPSMIFVSELDVPHKIAWVHADLDYAHWSKSWFASAEDERLCMEKFDKVVCVSDAVKRSIIKNVGDPGNLSVILNPLDVDNILKKSECSIDENKPAGKFLFVSVGRLSEQKNYLQLVDAVGQLDDDIKQLFEIWIIGDGEQRTEIEDRIAYYKLECVKLLGWKKNPYPYLKMADCYISSATWESFGLAIQEALILGLPVVATWWPALDEVFDDKYGIIINCDVYELSHAIKTMISDKDLLKEFRMNIKNNFDKSALWKDRIEQIYKLIE